MQTKCEFWDWRRVASHSLRIIEAAFQVPDFLIIDVHPQQETDLSALASQIQMNWDGQQNSAADAENVIAFVSAVSNLSFDESKSTSSQLHVSKRAAMTHAWNSLVELMGEWLTGISIDDLKQVARRFARTVNVPRSETSAYSNDPSYVLREFLRTDGASMKFLELLEAQLQRLAMQTPRPQ